jgi:hypothetical protein
LIKNQRGNADSFGGDGVRGVLDYWGEIKKRRGKSKQSKESKGGSLSEKAVKLPAGAALPRFLFSRGKFEKVCLT